MNITIMLYGILLIAGVFINIFIGKIAIFIFKKDGTMSRFPIRFLGVYMVLNSVSHIFYI